MRRTSGFERVIKVGVISDRPAFTLDTIRPPPPPARRPAIRRNDRRPVELVAACPDWRGSEGLHLAVTISTAAGLQRRVFAHGDSPRELALAMREASAVDRGVPMRGMMIGERGCIAEAIVDR